MRLNLSRLRCLAFPAFGKLWGRRLFHLVCLCHTGFSPQIVDASGCAHHSGTTRAYSTKFAVRLAVAQRVCSGILERNLTPSSQQVGCGLQSTHGNATIISRCFQRPSVRVDRVQSESASAPKRLLCRYLDLSFNNLTGQIPDAMVTLSNLSYVITLCTSIACVFSTLLALFGTAVTFAWPTTGSPAPFLKTSRSCPPSSTMAAAFVEIMR
jgi:hypothetical protein